MLEFIVGFIFGVIALLVVAIMYARGEEKKILDDVCNCDTQYGDKE